MATLKKTVEMSMIGLSLLQQALEGAATRIIPVGIKGSDQVLLGIAYRDPGSDRIAPIAVIATPALLELLEPPTEEVQRAFAKAVEEASHGQAATIDLNDHEPDEIEEIIDGLIQRLKTGTIH